MFYINMEQKLICSKNLERFQQGWQKPGFLKKKTQPTGFFWVLLGFLGFYCFWRIYSIFEILQ